MSNKTRVPIYLSVETEAEIRNLTDIGYAKSRNDFVNRAIEFYIGYLRNNKNIDFIAPILSSVMKSEMQSIEKNMAEIIFKLAVEVAKQNHLIATRMNLSEDVLNSLTDKCCRDVASNNGIITFESAYRYQNGEDGDEY